ncbi:S-adenosylmethionine:tRNA ribosyltransferase-isomerase, partial [bacterium]|nr:S-adenosylmethionine:tRNA ribosyltransferase-isomerase [bacterium]
LAQVKAQGQRVCAVGTTSLRSLESWAAQLQTPIAEAPSAAFAHDFEGETSLFIYPGFQFRMTDVLLTNFHLPKSSLFVLVCALAGTPLMQRAYAHAIAASYRFYSYGDAMLIAPHALSDAGVAARTPAA